ncbi:MAG: hypothetical protein DRN81_05005 [Thermoproteota archaeon]|nr:MAG: hypothetical protein DRN81_05005 [Candidatus Korarchaeota archaeon]
MNGLISENFKIVKGLAYSADVNNGDPASDIINMGTCAKAIALCVQNSGTTGTATITAEACSDFSGSDAEAIAFISREVPDGASDTMSEIVQATVAGITTTAGEDVIKTVEVISRDMPEGKPYLRIQLTEVVNAPVAGGITFLLDSSIKSENIPTAIA